MKTRIISLIALLLFATALKAQEKLTSIGKIGVGGFTIGYGNLDVSKLQNFVAGDVPTFENNQLLLGITGHTFINNLVLGLSGNAIMASDVKTTTLKIKSTGGQGTINFGYLILNKEKVKIYPLIGVGGSSYGLQISQNQNLSVADIVSNPGRELSINQTGIVLDGSLNMNIISPLRSNGKEGESKGFMAGLQVGYTYGFPNSNWTYSGGDVTNGPNFGLNMFYAKLILGGLWSSKK
jgi:hypothetical protein